MKIDSRLDKIVRQELWSFVCQNIDQISNVEKYLNKIKFENNTLDENSILFAIKGLELMLENCKIREKIIMHESKTVIPGEALKQ